MPRYITQATTKDAGGGVYFGSGTCLVQFTGACDGKLDLGASGGTAFNPSPCSGGFCALWTVPTGVCSVTFEIWGGGGGGGSMGGCTCCNNGFGGGGGGYARKTINVTPGWTYTVCAGAGGSGGGKGSSNWANSNLCCCGCRGGCTFVTGCNLSNFCAEGGYGGESRCSVLGGWTLPNGAYSYGGDLCVKGEDGGVWASDANNYSCRGITWGGGSPFGGKRILMGYARCAGSIYDAGYYPVQVGQDRSGGICGFTGMFPGGGGTGAWASCCCNICACGGDGAPGLVRIWM